MEFDLNTFLFGVVVGGAVIAAIAIRYAKIAEQRLRHVTWCANHWATQYAEALADNRKLAGAWRGIYGESERVEWPEELAEVGE